MHKLVKPSAEKKYVDLTVSFAPDADGDTAGVTISFIGFDVSKLTNCFNSNTDANRYALYQALTKVTGPDSYDPDDIIGEYFANTSSDGAYLIAEKAVNFFANGFSGNVITAPNNLELMFQELDEVNELWDDPSLDDETRQILSFQKEWLQRVPDALEAINNAAGRTIFDFNVHTITVQNKSNLTIHEKHAILASFTGNVTFNSFAAEVEFHADALDDWKSVIDKWKNSSIRADMSTGETYMRGFYEDYYDLDSELVQGQVTAHGEY